MMRLIADDESVDLIDATERASRWEEVRVGMKLGMITPENITWEHRSTVQDFFERVPIIEAVDARRGVAKVIGEADLMEGRDWAYATSRDGTFGVFSLDEPSRVHLEGAMFHLWIPDPYDRHLDGRVDFTYVGDYQDAALEAALAA